MKALIDSASTHMVLSKMDSMLESVVPHMQNGGEATVSFIVSLFIFKTILSILLTSTLCLVGLKLAKRCSKIKNDPSGNWTEEKWGGIVCSSIMVITFGIWTIATLIFSGPYLYAAINHPIVFTVFKLANKLGGCGGI